MWFIFFPLREGYSSGCYCCLSLENPHGTWILWKVWMLVSSKWVACCYWIPICVKFFIQGFRVKVLNRVESCPWDIGIFCFYKGKVRLQPYSLELEDKVLVDRNWSVIRCVYVKKDSTYLQQFHCFLCNLNSWNYCDMVWAFFLVRWQRLSTMWMLICHCDSSPVHSTVSDAARSVIMEVEVLWYYYFCAVRSELSSLFRQYAFRVEIL